MKISKAKLKQIILEELRNYYSDLDVNDGQPTDDIKLIKKTYRQRALQNHPDRGGDVEKMQKINAAGETLLKPAEKTKYDAELYRAAIEYKKKKPNARFDAFTGLNLSDESLKKLADMANISRPQTQSAGTDSSPEKQKNRSNEDFYRKLSKIRQGIFNRFQDAMNRKDLDAGNNFFKIYNELSNISVGDFEALDPYSIFAKFA